MRSCTQVSAFLLPGNWKSSGTTRCSSSQQTTFPFVRKGIAERKSDLVPQYTQSLLGASVREWRR
jgi:hypothetical protein